MTSPHTPLPDRTLPRCQSGAGEPSTLRAGKQGRDAIPAENQGNAIRGKITASTGLKITLVIVTVSGVTLKYCVRSDDRGLRTITLFGAGTTRNIPASAEVSRFRASISLIDDILIRGAGRELAGHLNRNARLAADWDLFKVALIKQSSAAAV